MTKKNMRVTPRSKIRAALRQLWMRSRERGFALKRDQHTCQECRKKQSKAKGRELLVNVHHLRGILWEEVIDIIYERILQTPEDYITLCEKCHDKLHAEEAGKETGDSGVRLPDEGALLHESHPMEPASGGLHLPEAPEVGRPDGRR